ncbi:hypothetical protein RYX36_026088 [Vicia faba]
MLAVSYVRFQLSSYVRVSVSYCFHGRAGTLVYLFDKFMDSVDVGHGWDWTVLMFGTGIAWYLCVLHVIAMADDGSEMLKTARFDTEVRCWLMTDACCVCCSWVMMQGQFGTTG